MNKLRQNGFWVLCGGLGAVLVGFVGLFVLPLAGDRSTKQASVVRLAGTLENQKGVVAGDNAIKAWTDRKEELIKDYQAIASFYRSRDMDIEKWLEKLGPLAEGQTPHQDQFMSPYSEATGKIDERLMKAHVGIGIQEDATSTGGIPKSYFGFNWPKLTEFPWNDVKTEDRALIIRALQKRYWIAEHVANACASGEEPLVHRLVDLWFFKPIEKLQDPIGGATARPQYLAAPRGGFQSASETDLPDKLGTTITFGMAVELSYERLPEFLKQLLYPAQSPHVILNITACRIFVDKCACAEKLDSAPLSERCETCKKPQNPVEINERAEPADVAKKKKELEEAVHPLRTTVWLTCQVLDFNPAGFPKWAE
ncbi:MAG: hypothetical protein HYY16_12575 [Planctomycetes bacterium]|nr:hypothetical protein [Planctomycetota bacterium]